MRERHSSQEHGQHQEFYQGREQESRRGSGVLDAAGKFAESLRDYRSERGEPVEGIRRKAWELRERAADRLRSNSNDTILRSVGIGLIVSAVTFLGVQMLRRRSEERSRGDEPYQRAA